MMRFLLAVLAYVVPTFALGFVWHLILFKHYYEALAIYRSDIIIPFGFVSMLIQACVFAWIYEKAFAKRSGTVLSRAGLCRAWCCSVVELHHTRCRRQERDGIGSRLSHD